MSAEARPITAEAFAEALTALPLGSVYSKALELHNSMAHLERSNVELRLFIQETPDGDKDCEEAIAENEGVMKRMSERIELVKAEVEGRGQKWIDLLGPTEGEDNGEDTTEMQSRTVEAAPTATGAQDSQQHGSRDARPAESNGVNGESTAGDAGSRTERENNETEEGVYL